MRSSTPITASAPATPSEHDELKSIADRLAKEDSRISNTRRPFELTEDERKTTFWGRNPNVPSASRSILLDRDGCTIEAFSATFVQATLLTFQPGTLDPVDPRDTARHQNLMGDAMLRCYLHWCSISGGRQPFCYMSDLQVPYGWRRRGLGSWMVKQVQRSCPGPRLYLAANSSGDMRQHELYGFYEKLGFNRITDTAMMHWVNHEVPTVA